MGKNIFSSSIINKAMSKRANNFADNRNFAEAHIETSRGKSGTILKVSLDFSTADSVGIAVAGVADGGFKKVNVFLADHHDNQVAVSGTDENIAKTVKNISGFAKGDDLRLMVFAVKANEVESGETPLLATSQPDGLIRRSVVDALVASLDVEFKY